MPQLQTQRRDEELEAEIGRIVSIVASRFCGAWRYLDKRELEAEGWQACLAARGGYRPDAGPAEAYFRVIARRAMGKFCSATVAAVSMGRKVRDGAKYQKRASLTDWNHDEIDPRYAERVEGQLSSNAEVAVLEVEEDEQKTAWRERVRAHVDEAMARFTAWEKFVAYRLHGLDGYRAERPAELAERIGCPVRKVYKVHARLEKAIWRVPALYQLHKEG